MPRTTYHVVPHEDRWAVRKQNSTHNTRVSDDKDEAIDIATGFARNQAPSRLIIHDDDGRIDEQRTFAAADADDAADDGDESGLLGFDLPETPTVLAVAGAVAIGLGIAGLFYLHDRRTEQRKAAARRRRATPTSATGSRHPDPIEYPRHDRPGILRDPVAVPPRERNQPSHPGSPPPKPDTDATDPADPNDPVNFRD